MSDPDWVSDFGEPAHPHKPIVLCDMDGVIVDLLGWIYDEWHARHPNEPLLPRETLREFYVDQEHPEAYKKRLRSLLREPGAFLDPDPIPGALDGLGQLAEHAEVFLCTAPMWSNPTCVVEKIAWVRRHLGEEWTDRIVITKDKTTVRGNWLIDDRPSIPGRLIPHWRHVVFTQPYNNHVHHDHRLDGWDDLPALIDRCFIPWD